MRHAVARQDCWSKVITSLSTTSSLYLVDQRQRVAQQVSFFPQEEQDLLSLFERRFA